ncbi:hypothetical protein PRK78_004950 [Emydomyces testavorans]|uniref:DUF7924 domain-containing protein n=1 Tax=Emydomyces testavorans TaxID=2070801 RepID=A0AAF0DIT3_9EURO|nr:hypothetical protein PRK78_004950 [Emydomyces testavorans]
MAVPRKKRRTAPPPDSKTDAPRHLRSSQAQEATTSHVQHSSDEKNCANPPKSRKRPREAEVEQVTGRTKRSRKLVQQPKSKKRPRETLGPVRTNRTEAPQKQEQQFPRNTVVETLVDEEAANQVGEEGTDPLRYWIKANNWPKGFAEQSNSNMSYLLARQKFSNCLRRRRSESASTESTSTPSSTTPSDQKPRELKSAPYQDARYETLLATKGSFMRRYLGENEEGVTNEAKALCQTLLATDCGVPENSIFDEECFDDACEVMQDRNEAKIIQDITQLIVPRAQSLAIRGAKHLNCLIESVNEGWNNSIPLTGTRPQPDYSVGFRRKAFSKDQLDKLAPFIGDFISGDQSFFMATYYMYFPFLTCEVKCGNAGLEIADRQNAHSMTLAVRAIVELFRLINHERELHREILAFSISHDHRSVRIYGHYPVIDGKDAKYYRHAIRTFDFTELNGKEKWTAYKFTKSIYDTWMPAHFGRLCSAIDKIPVDLDFSVPELSPSFGLEQGLKRRRLSESTELESQSTEPNQSVGVAGDAPPNSPFDQGARKRQRKGLAAGPQR